MKFADKIVYFLNHTSDPSEGNWITMGSPDDVRKDPASSADKYHVFRPEIPRNTEEFSRICPPIVMEISP